MADEAKVAFVKELSIWVVVLVESGIPTLVEAYSAEDDATIREQFLRDAMNFDYDETGVFEVKIGHGLLSPLKEQKHLYTFVNADLATTQANEAGAG